MKPNKILIIILIIFTGIFAILISMNNILDTPGINYKAPDFKIKNVKTGEELLSESFKGKVVFLNFWASWCRPCRLEMSSINTLYRKMKKYTDFKMLTILYKDNKEDALSYLKAKNYEVPVHIDADLETAKKFHVTGVPETYIINKKGMVVKVIKGSANWISGENIGDILSLLNEK